MNTNKMVITICGHEFTDMVTVAIGAVYHGWTSCQPGGLSSVRLSSEHPDVLPKTAARREEEPGE